MRTPITKTAKGHRVWIQGTCTKYGWPVGARYDVTYGTEGAIWVTLNPEGKRKVSSGKGGIIDLVSSKVTQWAQGSDTATVAVNPERTQIIIVNE